MKIEKWMKWEPLKGIPQTLYLVGLKYGFNGKFGFEGLTVNLQGQNDNSPILTIYFDIDCLFGLRITDEGNLLKGRYDIDEALIEMKKEKNSSQKWSLFTIENSRYLEWFHEQSVGVRRDINMTHYSIKTPDDVIDVLHVKELSPTVMWN